MGLWVRFPPVAPTYMTNENKMPELEYLDWISVETMGHIPVIRVCMESGPSHRYTDVATNMGYVDKESILEIRGLNGKYWKRS